MLRLMFAAFVAAAAGIFAASAPALAVTYNLTLVKSEGVADGSGSFSVTGPISGSGIQDFFEGGSLTAMSFSINTPTVTTVFNLSNNVGNAMVRFFNGAVDSMLFHGSTSSGILSLQISAMQYFYYDMLTQELGRGQIIATLVPEQAPDPTPIPGAAFLMGSVLAGGAGFGAWRRRRKSA